MALFFICEVREMDWLFSKSLPALKLCESLCLPYPPQVQLPTLLSSSLSPGRQSCLEHINGRPNPLASSWVWPNRQPKQEERGNKKAKTGVFPLRASLPVGSRQVGFLSLDWRSRLPWNIVFHTALSTQFPLQIPDYHSQLPPSGLKMVVTTPGDF